MASMQNIPENLTVGFLGAGRMAQALSKGFITSGLVRAENMIASDVDPGILKFIAESGVKTTLSNEEVVEKSRVIIIAVKPHIVSPALTEVARVVTKDHLIVSIAAGITIETIQGLLPAGTRVIRVMPNTPALVLCGASVYSPGFASTAADGHLVASLFSSIGICETLPEPYLDAVTGLSGSGPAYAFMAIEAMADGGVRMGLPRDTAQKLAAQTLMGAAKMVLETGSHPGVLKDGVCSPGGTTIAAVQSLEKDSFRAALINAVESATKRSKELGAKL
jgi:pyrroline-5-carboxylate reductase